MKSRASNSRITISPAREAAFEILLRIDREGSYASELLHSQKYQGLSEVDHSLATEIVMGVLRWRSLVDSEIAAKSSQPLSKLDLEVLTALRLALYQLRYLDRVPAWAAINSSVELVKRARKRSAAPFVNAILRKFASDTSAKEKQPALVADSATPKKISESCAHPLWLVERWTQNYGIEAALRICRQNQSIPGTAIRLRDPEAEARLRAEGIELARGAILSSARIVQHGDITKTAAFKQGLCVIQDEASQLVAALVGRGASVLDCCAAPGGKTLAIADQNPHAGIAALELHPHRAALLKRLLSAHSPNLNRGSRAIQVIAGDARNLPFASHFDRVLADVPCSGTGTLARNPEIKWRLKAADLADLQARQVAILRSAMKQVAVGGRLIYSTCSLEKEENEEVIERALVDESSFRVLECAEELELLRQQGELTLPDIASLTRGPFLRTIPGIHPCDGFFAAVLKKV
ncbi:MAG: 16S rRNA (cytosine(967)-C(5))-methyltransferase RsmB [Candidatus Sulfotelmatobacter sp.]